MMPYPENFRFGVYMDPMYLIFLVLLVCGVLGGLVNSYGEDAPLEGKALSWWKQVVIGVAASFMVPLFLNMISSSLLDSIRGTGGATGAAGDQSKLFVLAGFALVAAISSRAFITTITSRVLQEVRIAKDEAKQAHQIAVKAQSSANQAEESVQPFLETDSSEQSGPEKEKQETFLNSLDLDSNELSIMKALAESSFSMRSMNGLLKATLLETTPFNVALSTLMKKGLVAQGKSKSDYPRWYLTSEGRILFAQHGSYQS
jgi:hypothetical protein